ncbi:gamma carbonic anhydrase family protein [Sphingomonas quercus]|uniref:Gamma carbonic anhydrase family protein n=1 Tax=Sphingomonas quercus TaxID=2842451 RepID=A0ABS6BLN5_9SPHN|nr:gamma carbonic anhydrase family protein [Sphingomonas quercus]MBU3079216.1 gamma carbonic anhydrase family protein [Sphingomonas quercus]
MSLHTLDQETPVLADPDRVYIAPGARLIGRIHVGLDVSIWFNVVIRGDNDLIAIGDRTNIQDGAIVHADPGVPATIGPDCTIGHRAIVHGATIGAGSLIGMGATVLNGAVIGANSLVGANALVTEGKVFPEGSLIVGTPAKLVRPLTPAEIEGLRKSAEGYVANGRRFAAGLS